MALAYHFDLYPRTDPVNGVRVARLTGLLEQLYRGEANGTGSGRFAVRASSATGALLNPLGLEYVRVVRDDGSTEKVVGGFWTERGTYQVVNRKRTRRLTVGGAGTLAYLARAVMAHESYLTVPFIGTDPFDDTWRLYGAGTGNELGAILWRVIRELQEAGRPRDPIPGVVMTFDYNTDSNGVPWSRSSGDFTAQVGESVLDVVRRLMQLGLYVELDPDTFELNAYEPGTHERDRTGLAWASNVVRLQVSGDGTEEDGNILNESERGVEALVRRSDLLVGAQDVYEWVTDPAADMVWEGAYRVEDESGASFSAIGQAQLDARADAADPGRIRLKLGSAPTAGEYLPFETTGVLADDLVTVDSGAGTWDWDESTQRVAALTIQRRRGGDWTLVADLGTRFASMEERAFRATPVGPHNHPPNPRLCDPSTTVETSTAWKATATASPPVGWHDAGFDDSGYGAAVNTTDPGFYNNPDSRWVWSTSGTESDASLRREFTLDELPTSAVVRFGVDGAGSLYVNGDLIASYDVADASWLDPPVVSVHPSHFVVGANCISIVATDEDALGEPDGAYAVLTLNPEAGTSNRASRCHHTHLVESLLTTETDTSKRIAPDGIGGVEWVAMAEGLVAWFDVTAYGATGDGTTDDTAAINAAIAALNTAGVGRLYFPGGTYATTGALTAITARCIVMGDGASTWNAASGSSLITSSSATNALLTITSNRARIEHLGLKNVAGGTPSAGAGIVAAPTSELGRVDYLDVSLDGFYVGVDSQIGTAWVMDSCLFRSQVLYSVRVRNTINDDYGDWAITGCGFWGGSGSTAAIRVESSGGGRITNNKVNVNGSAGYAHGVDLTIASGVQTVILLVEGNSFENVTSHGVRVNTLGTGTWDHLIIVGNQFGFHVTPTSGQAISLAPTSTGQVGEVIIGGNVFFTNGSNRHAVQLTNIDNVKLFGNVLGGSFTSLYQATGSTNVEELGGTHDHDADYEPAGAVATHDAAGDAHAALFAAIADAGLLTVDAGTPTYDDSGADVVISLASKWGYDADGPYYNSAGVTAGEEAILAFDPAVGDFTVKPYNP